MKHILSNRIVHVLILGICVLLASRPVFAQNLTLSISPPLIESAIKPGKSILIAYTVSNLGDPSVLSSHVRPFSPNGVLGDIIVEGEFEGPIRFNLENSDLELEDKFFLESNEGQQLLLKIRVPEGTPEGDYYYTFYIQNDLGRGLEGANAAQGLAQVGANILVTVTESGKIDVNGSIGILETQPRYALNLFGKKINIFESTDDVPVNLILQNTGRNVIKPQGEVILEGGFGETVRYPLLPANILSQSSRLAEASQSAQLRTPQSKDPATVTFQGFFVGGYTITADVNFGQGSESRQQSVSFIALPFKLIIATLVAIIVSITAIKRINKDSSDSLT